MEKTSSNTTEQQGSCGNVFNSSSALAPFTYQTWMATWDKIGYLKTDDTAQRIAYDDIVDILPTIPENVSRDARVLYLREQMKQLEMRTIDIPQDTYFAMREELEHQCYLVHPALLNAPDCTIDIRLEDMQPLRS